MLAHIKVLNKIPLRRAVGSHTNHEYVVPRLVNYILVYDE